LHEPRANVRKLTELMGRYAAVDDREQMGRFLRHAFPLGLASFTELLSTLKSAREG